MLTAGRSGVRAAWVLLLSTALLAAPATGALADPTCQKVSERTGVCLVQAEDPGTPGPGTEPPSSGGGGGAPVPQPCMYGREEMPCENELGRWSNSRQCYFEIADPPPPPDHFVWEGHPEGEGVVYRCMAPNPATSGSFWEIFVWLATAEPGPAPRELAEQAVAEMDLRAGQIGTNPAADADRPAIVGLPTWLWIADPSESTVGPITRTASAGAVTVTATARLDRVVWAMGDGHSVTCDGPGQAWQPGLDPRAEPPCGYAYRRSSASRPDQRYTITATSFWVVTWEGGGESGTITLDLANDTTARVAEVQTLVTVS